jgi:hypothetical protein
MIAECILQFPTADIELFCLHRYRTKTKHNLYKYFHLFYPDDMGIVSHCLKQKVLNFVAISA